MAKRDPRSGRVVMSTTTREMRDLARTHGLELYNREVILPKTYKMALLQIGEDSTWMGNVTQHGQHVALTHGLLDRCQAIQELSAKTWDHWVAAIPMHLM